MVDEQFQVCSVERSESVWPTSQQSRISTDDSQSPEKKSGVNQPPSRSNPQFIVELEGQDMKKHHYTEFIESVYVEDTCDKIPIARIIFNNEDGRFTNEPLFDADKKLKVYVGYPEAGIESKVGIFYTRPAKKIFTEKPQIIIEGWGEEVLMSFPERRRLWNDAKDSDIAQEIADAYGFEAIIDETDEQFPQITQANESDMNFLIRRAKLYGYVVYVKFSTLHFHAPKYTFSEVSLRYRQGEQSTLAGFSVETLRDYRAKQYTASQMDPITQEYFQVEGSDLQDEISKTTSERFDNVDLWDKLMKANQQTPYGYLVNEGHSQTKERYQSYVDARAKVSRWILRGSGSCIGLQNLNAGDTINLLGIGRWGGEYLMTKVVHDYVGGGYRIYFDVTRTWTLSATEAEKKRTNSDTNMDKDDTLSSSDSVGEASVAA